MSVERVAIRLYDGLDDWVAEGPNCWISLCDLGEDAGGVVRAYLT